MIIVVNDSRRKMKNLPEIRVVLNGGLGNQMFQYAAARALALRHGYGLAVDAWSGFVRDREFRRHYELHAFPINARKLGPFERLPVWVHKLHQRVSKKENESPVRSHWYGSFINENHRLFPQFEQMRLKGTVWLTGDDTKRTDATPSCSS